MNRLREQKAMLNAVQGVVLVLAWKVGGWSLALLCFAAMWAYPTAYTAVVLLLVRRRERKEAKA